MRRRGGIIAAAVAVVAVTAWQARAVVGAPFLGDDYNEVSSGAAGPSAWFASTGDNSFFRPLTLASYGLDHAIGGYRPIGYHVSGLLLHLVSCLLVGLLAVAVLDLVPGGPIDGAVRRRAGVVAALVFALSASHEEVLHWVSARADVLATALGLGSVLLFLRWRRGGGTRRDPRYLAAVALSVLALSAKESAVAIVGVVAVLAFATDGGRPLGPRARAACADAAAFAAATLGWLLLRWAVLGEPVGGYGTAGLTGGGPFGLIRGGGAAVTRTVLPPMPVWLWAVAVAVAAGAALLGVVAFARARTRGASDRPLLAERWQGVVGLLAAGAVSIVPVAALGVEVDGPGGDRTVYLASALVAAAVGLAVTGLRRRTVVVGVAVVALVSVLLAIPADARWRRSAHLAEVVVDAIDEQPSGASVLVVNLPDDVDGAVTLRNSASGLPYVLEERDRPVWTVSAVHRTSGPDPVGFSVDGRDGALRMAVRPVSGAPAIVLSPNRDEGPWTIERSADGYTVTFDTDGLGDLGTPLIILVVSGDEVFRLGG